MKIIHSKEELKSEISLLKANKLSIGFVPTMGALHNGHKALVERSVAENDCTVVSIFVNPTQFNNPTDLEKYPRTLERDAAMLETVGCDIIFAPSTNDIYDNSELSTTFDFDFGGLDVVMEGRFRPGHFNGVVQIVSKLFDFVQPSKAYFGEKDFQQLAIIHRMVKVLGVDIEIIDCPIVREESGLAMSSRNERLTNDQRLIAVQISKILFQSVNFAEKLSPWALTQWVTDSIELVDGLKLEYFEIVDATTLQVVEEWSNAVAVGCIAVFCGEVRLIDNIKYGK